MLRRLRLVAPDLPFVSALDLTAHVSEALVSLCDVLVAYRTYPHVDLAAIGARCRSVGRISLGSVHWRALSRKNESDRYRCRGLHWGGDGAGH